MLNLSINVHDKRSWPKLKTQILRSCPNIPAYWCFSASFVQPNALSACLNRNIATTLGILQVCLFMKSVNMFSWSLPQNLSSHRKAVVIHYFDQFSKNCCGHNCRILFCRSYIVTHIHGIYVLVDLFSRQLYLMPSLLTLPNSCWYQVQLVLYLAYTRTPGRLGWHLLE